MNVIRKKKQIFIPMSSMADIAFLLLIFFMLSKTIKDKERIKIQLPKIKKIYNIKTKNSIKVLIDKNGNIYIKGKKLKAKDLYNYIITNLPINKTKNVFIYGDKDCKFISIWKVFSTLRNLELYDIYLICKSQK